MATKGNCVKCSGVIWNRKTGYCQKCSPLVGKYQRTKKIKLKLSETRKDLFAHGLIVHPRGMLGKKHTPETLKRIGESSKNNPFRNRKSYREALSKALMGHICSDETKRKIAEKAKLRIGEKNHQWKGGITPLNKKIRSSIEYELWRESVFIRDNYTCLFCGKHGGELHADHIKPFAYFPELRFAIDNGRTLCISCHRKTDTFGHKAIKNHGS